MLSDFWPHGNVAMKYGVLRSEGYTERAIFVIDDLGIIRYIDVHDIDEQPSNKVLFDEIKKLRPGYVDEVVDPSKIKLPHGGIVMYCTKWCPDCRRARLWLNEKGLKYTEVDVMSTVGADDQVRLWTGGNLVTPTFDIDGQIVIDFDEDKLREVLKM
jgi:glutaredoxin